MKNLPANAGDGRDTALVLRSGRSPRGGNGNPLQYSCLGNLRCRCNDIMVAMDASSIQILISQFSSVQLLSHVQLFAAPWIASGQASLSITISRRLLKLMPIELVMPSSHLILCHPLLLPAPNLSQHRGLFQWVSSSHQVGKVLEFQLQHQSFQWTPRTDLL